jgi:hypothetical protein
MVVQVLFLVEHKDAFMYLYAFMREELNNFNYPVCIYVHITGTTAAFRENQILKFYYWYSFSTLPFNLTNNL